MRVIAREIIEAAPERVSSLYRDYARWPQLFPMTIRAVRLIRDEGATKTIEVAHATAGTVVNVMRAVSPDEIELREFKRRYDATFTNRFDRHARGTRYTVTADVKLKGWLRALAFIAAPIARRQITRFVLLPMKRRAESLQSSRGAALR